MERNQIAYINYKKWSVRYDLTDSTFRVKLDGMGDVIRDAHIVSICSARNPQPDLEDYEKPIASISRAEDSRTLVISCKAKTNRQDMILIFTCSDAGVNIAIGGEGTMTTIISGLAFWGEHDQTETMAVSIGRQGYDLRSAYGPAASTCDNALFDRDTDRAIVFNTCGTFRLRFDWEAKAYRFVSDSGGLDFSRGFHISVKERVYENLFNNGYKKMNPNTTFKTPPVGWMSWYAVQFKASEKTVMENARWQAEHLKEYGADTIWVDWEWYHRDFSSVGAKDLDMYNPDPITYPNGLKAVAEQISELGFIPALWIGPTCDPSENEMIKKYPEAVMIKQLEWCGQYFLDPTHPKFLDEMLVKMVRQPLEWGYKAVKWDCLPTTTDLADKCHDTIYGAVDGLSSREAMLKAFRKAREILGDDTYMLYCAGVSQRDIDLACQVFDAARIGGDIFSWSEFVSQCVEKVYKYYALHDVVLGTDPDNVVLREEFNSLEQAVTRACFVSLLGLPYTFGDHLPDLDEARVDIIKSTIPSLKSHPMDIRTGTTDGIHVKVNLAIDRPDMRYNVLSVTNLLEEPFELRIDFSKDVHLEPDLTYLVFDYWGQEFLGKIQGGFMANLEPHESKVYAIHELKDIPQVVSTCRHISQGALEIISLIYDPRVQTIKGCSHVVGGEDYHVVVHAPEGFSISLDKNDKVKNVESIGHNGWRVCFGPETSGEFVWEIYFQSCE